MIGRFTSWSGRPNGPGWMENENGCHIWTGALTNGYAYASDGMGRSRYVHRMRYEREVGPVPEGLVLDHYVCSNPKCVNPKHCRPVTHRENALRGEDTAVGRRRAQSCCKHGHPLSPDNLRSDGLANGTRKCKTCARIRARGKYWRMKGVNR